MTLAATARCLVLWELVLHAQTQELKYQSWQCTKNCRRAKTGDAFVVVDPEKGTGNCWGKGGMGGDCSHIDFTGVTSVHCTHGACIAVRPSLGTVSSWGSAAWGSSGIGLGGDWTGMTEVYTTDRGWVGYDRSTNRWVSSERTGFSQTSRDATKAQIMNRKNDFLMYWPEEKTFEYKGGLLEDVISGVTEVVAASNTWVLWNPSEGKAQCLGRQDWGGDCTGVDFSNVRMIAPAWYSYVAIKNDGTCELWGLDKRRPADCGEYSFDFSDITDIWAGAYNFVAYSRSQKSGFCWGDQGACPDIDFSGSPIAEMSDGNLFLAVKDSGEYIGHNKGIIKNCLLPSELHPDAIQLKMTSPTALLQNSQAIMAYNADTHSADCCGDTGKGGNCAHMTKPEEPILVGRACTYGSGALMMLLVLAGMA